MEPLGTMFTMYLSKPNVNIIIGPHIKGEIHVKCFQLSNGKPPSDIYLKSIKGLSVLFSSNSLFVFPR